MKELRPASEFTAGQKEFIIKAVTALALIADNIKPHMTPEEFTECLERQTICE